MHVIRIDSTSTRCSTPLVVRASLSRTFRGLGAFAELGLFSCGFYLLSEASLKPMETDQGSVLGASVLLALAAVLLFYLVRPHRKEALPRADVRRPTWDSHETSALAERDGSPESLREIARGLLDDPDLPGPM